MDLGRDLHAFLTSSDPFTQQSFIDGVLSFTHNPPTPTPPPIPAHPVPVRFDVGTHVNAFAVNSDGTLIHKAPDNDCTFTISAPPFTTVCLLLVSLSI